MKSPQNEKNAQTDAGLKKLADATNERMRASMRSRAQLRSFAERRLAVAWEGEPDPKCLCDLCAAERGRTEPAPGRIEPSKRLDASELGAMIFWEAALATALLEAIGDGVSTAEAVTLAERHLKRVRALADELLRA